jgi:hypothetical protein
MKFPFVRLYLYTHEKKGLLRIQGSANFYIILLV